MRKLEEIAAAMCAQCAAEFGGPAKLEDSPSRESWISSARVAVRAMREPDGNVISRLHYGISEFDVPPTLESLLHGWQAAIDAILSEEDGE